MARFVDCAGRVYAYRKDDPEKLLHVRPSEIAFEKYYYSQPLPEGGRENNRFEEMFSAVETHWPRLVDDLAAGRDVRDRMELFFRFIGLLRVRVPAARDPVELHLARMVQRTAIRLVRNGKIPPPPPGHEALLEEMVVAIDPHKSLHAMADMLKGFGRLMGYIGFEVVHNTSDEAFITSDNPVVVFDPDVPEARVLPYTVRPPHRRIELFLPITPKEMIRGRSGLPAITPGMQPSHTEMARAVDVRRVNQFVARFAYRFVFANHPGVGKLVTKYAALSPTVRLDDVPVEDEAEYHFMQMIFGPRPKKPKWQTKD